MNLGQVWYLSGSLYRYHVTKSDSEIFSDGFIHSDFSLFQFIINQCHDEGFFTFLSLNENGIAFEDFELRHFSLRQLDG